MSLTSSSSLSPPYGAHPTIVTDVQAPGDTESSACSLYLHYSLPPILFVDPYELDMRQQQYTVVGLKGKGARELEKPVHALPDEDGIEVILKTDSVVEQVQLPIHVRYGKPTFNTSYVVQPLDAPTVVLACSSSVSRS
ncbi:hypothetical protein EST38_g11960 [Candolleomyces aberdarensis]|uniref:Protein PBN1 n=1 Tax=Candolleomyces aberdarensis TaxID=2316362 RepID=A0A4Q2D3L8_9AGAR|nr:hypothetical protein EST38_g11960 [Candolleomyces aberdarensis]